MVTATSVTTSQLRLSWGPGEPAPCYGCAQGWYVGQRGLRRPAMPREGGWGSTGALAGTLCCSGPDPRMFASERKPLTVGCICRQPCHRRTARGLQTTTATQEP